ncbi:hypothetical protein BDC45DRAFT_401522, partial [Circinella umbellata]
LRTYHGAVDQNALTSRSPQEVLIEVKQTLISMGIDVKDDGEFKLKCVRRRHRPALPNSNNSNASVNERNNSNSIIYGDPVVDPGEEVRFSMELCKIKNLPGLYIVDIRRMRGNVWSYKFLYHAVL